MAINRRRKFIETPAGMTEPGKDSDARLYIQELQENIRLLQKQIDELKRVEEKAEKVVVKEQVEKKETPHRTVTQATHPVYDNGSGKIYITSTDELISHFL